jgi:hypothetical protein
MVPPEQGFATQPIEAFGDSLRIHENIVRGKEIEDVLKDLVGKAVQGS